MNPIISIIIPTYNRAHLLGETLDSVISQTYQNWECILVDDGSTDYTEELSEFYCEKDSRIQFHERPKGLIKGANSCRNHGFEISKGHYINWFDSDDVMLPEFLKDNLRGFKEKTQLIICSGFITNAVLEDRKPILLKNNIDLFKYFVVWEQPILINSVIFRKSFLNNKELFNPRIIRGQEAELFSRLFFKLTKDKYLVNIQRLFLYRQHAGTITTKNQDYHKSHKKSEAYILIENLKRSLSIKDFELNNILYKRLINFFFLGIKNNHSENSRFILKNLYSILWYNNPIFSLELFVAGNLIVIIKRGSYTIERRWKFHKISV
ncbi:glycosyltransferase involved in cell wall biosynthesis [Gillisia mitskevichiae]|uniref:Glycosyltransferase involved in cell wall biosynthesis n=1 Tax=Gillisia mitskevichiae TaxID=270921 RepID=A0A495P392_9FLAO|nr:glycosyltransferase family 2 protein [Gillisia mitskevichiae]RKS45131.1 glycosyltransferase involved in cell wall biosynthesis [Gillisia mitskevichiae]